MTLSKRDVTALLRDDEDQETAILQATFAEQVLEGSAPRAGVNKGRTAAADAQPQRGAPEERPMRPGHPTLEQLLHRVETMGVDRERFQRYADGRWGRGWKVNPHGRGRAWDEVERHANDPEGYADKIDCALGALVERG